MSFCPVFFQIGRRVILRGGWGKGRERGLYVYGSGGGIIFGEKRVFSSLFMFFLSVFLFFDFLLMLSMYFADCMATV